MGDVPKKLTVLVCGGRDFLQVSTMWRFLDEFLAGHPNWTTLVHGAARGADTMAGDWAKSRGIDVIEEPADWDGMGSRAGPRRNQRMLDKHDPQVLIWFPGGAGTKDMVKRARAHGCHIVEGMPGYS